MNMLVVRFGQLLLDGEFNPPPSPPIIFQPQILAHPSTIGTPPSNLTGELVMQLLDHLVTIGDIAKQLKLSLESNGQGDGLIAEFHEKSASPPKKILSDSHTLKLTSPKEVGEIPICQHRKIQNKE